MLHDPYNSVLPTVFKYYMKSHGNWPEAKAQAEHDRVDSRARYIIEKAAVSGMGFDNNDLTVIGAIGAYVESLALDSVHRTDKCNTDTISKCYKHATPCTVT
jgi:hypothetical protein